MSIRVISISGKLPLFDEYVTHFHRNPKSKKVPEYLIEKDQHFRSCCDCPDNCADRSKCACVQLTMSAAGSKSLNVSYNYKRLFNKVETGIYECNSGCKCNDTCLNRLVKSHVDQKLEVFETVDRGYGVRTMKDLPRGTFISCYFGDLLHGRTADMRGSRSGEWYGDEYFMSLDHIETAEKSKEDYESDVVESDADDDENNDNDDNDDLESESLAPSHISLSSGSSDDEQESVPSKKRKLNENENENETANADTNDLILNSQQQNGRAEVLSYFPTINKIRPQKEINQRTDLFGENATEFVVDGRFRGNVSRFFNVSISYCIWRPCLI